MAYYNYSAVNDKGATLKGTIEAPNIDAAKNNIADKGLLLLEIDEAGILDRDIGVMFTPAPSARDLGVFARMFVSMLRAGVSLVEAMSMLEEQTENKALAKGIREARISVEKGETLASAMEQNKKVFPDLMIHMVAAGEASGSLDLALERVAIQLEKTARTRAMVRKAMIYPIMVSIVALGVVIVMLLVVIPTYSELFEDLGTDLPAITKSVIGASEFLKTYWFIILLFVVGLIILIRYFKETYAGQKFFGGIELKIPVLRDLRIKSNSALMARTLGSLLSSGVGITEAVGIVANTVDNIYFKEAMEMARDQITIGLPLSKPLTDSQLFPPMVCHMIKIGEEAGNTEEMLERLADYYDEEVEQQTGRVMAVLEPMIIIVMALVVSFLIASILAPMMHLYDALDAM
jgi:type IV pilus assembly protein PilC